MNELPKPYFEENGITIYHGDCREILPLLPKVDLVLTDPPFSSYAHSNAKSNRDKGYGNNAIDFPAIDFPAIENLLGQLASLCSRWLIATLDWRHIAELERSTPANWEFVRFGVWVKTNPMPQISADRPANGWDGIAYLHKAETSKRWNGGGNHGNWIGSVITNGDHPTSKPVAMIRTMVERFSDAGDCVLDPFMGSGTTLVAAKQLGRRAIGIELEEKYCAVAVERLRQQVLQFEPPEQKPEEQLGLLGAEDGR